MSVKEKILEYLKDCHNGADNALVGRRLSANFGIDTPTLRRIINQLRTEKHPICSNGYGYFYSTDSNEINHTIAHLASRSSGMLKAIEGLLSAKSLLEQSKD